MKPANLCTCLTCPIHSTRPKTPPPPSSELRMLAFLLTFYDRFTWQPGGGPTWVQGQGFGLNDACHEAGKALGFPNGLAPERRNLAQALVFMLGDRDPYLGKRAVKGNNVDPESRLVAWEVDGASLSDVRSLIAQTWALFDAEHRQLPEEA